MPDTSTLEADVVLIGAGIMSATLGVFLRELEPSLRIELFEALKAPALESSEAWNNAGTGHAANCELNYTPQRADGSVDISRALEVNVEFDLSRQFWSFLVKKGSIKDPQSFIHSVPHMSFVTGAENVSFLRKRFEAMSAHHCYHGMEYADDRNRIGEWAPLVMEGRTNDEPVAATRIVTGTDVDYGALTNHLIDHLVRSPGFAVHYRRRVTGINRAEGGRWRVEVEDASTGGLSSVTTKFVFIGAGGGALPLLQKSGIPEGRGYGGFPVSGIWLRCDDPGVNQAPSCQGLWKSRRRVATHVSAASRHARDRRPTLVAVWPLCRLLDQIFEAWLVARFARVCSAEQYRAVAFGCARRFRPYRISHRATSSVGKSSTGRSGRVLPERQG